MIMLHPLAVRVKKPVGIFWSGLFAIKPPSHLSNKENLRFPDCRRAEAAEAISLTSGVKELGKGIKAKSHDEELQRPGRERSGSNPVAPTFFRNEPFGEYVEGLFHCEDASYRSTSVFKWHCTMVEITRKSDETPLFVWRNVVQIPSPVLRWQLCELPTRRNEQWA
jgi:hypothetical protein